MKKLFAVIILCLNASLVSAGEKFSYQNWVAEMGGQTNEAYTIADASTSFGTFCSNEQCLFYLHQNLNCTPGAKYSVLMNSPSISTALTMECTPINGNVFRILTPYNAVLQATQAGESIGFAVALQSGAFAVTRFSLLGAKPAIDRVLTEAANSKQREQKPPQIIIVPPLQIVPRVTPNQPPGTPQNAIPKSNSKDISI
ncbi:hypothetical protein ICN46_11085 [Polynucleobacter sp. Latsch14-2]|uniref:hypothetical protein n=1 Tax=Polynucleobacter sp. Latsch14-2 TaxID=2576920 RepID=UPI001C0BF111|nr:hypothetical protein [Polynucleobacter sp. Latsch14-2]MBU3615434.1 hypothetical protein [Polynucleobacter sp. Latsch14-2]